MPALHKHEGYSWHLTISVTKAIGRRYGRIRVRLLLGCLYYASRWQHERSNDD